MRIFLKQRPFSLKMDDPLTVYGIMDIFKPAPRSIIFNQVTPRTYLLGAGIDIMFDFHVNHRIDVDFDFSPDGNQLRVYHSGTGKQFYQAYIGTQEGESVVIVEPLTPGAVRHLRHLDCISEMVER